MSIFKSVAFWMMVFVMGICLLAYQSSNAAQPKAYLTDRYVIVTPAFVYRFVDHEANTVCYVVTQASSTVSPSPSVSCVKQ
jgi:hypothetical protein